MKCFAVNFIVRSAAKPLTMASLAYIYPASSAALACPTQPQTACMAVTASDDQSNAVFSVVQ